jgi:hypothetical protein
LKENVEEEEKEWKDTLFHISSLDEWIAGVTN